MANAAGMFIELVEKIDQEFAWHLPQYVGDPNGKGLEVYQRFLTEGKGAFEERGDTEILVALGTNEAVDFLIQALKDPDQDVRSKAITALNKIGSERAVEPLLHQALKDPDRDVEGGAAESLGDIKAERAVEALIQALKDPEEIVQWMAAESLGQIFGPTGSEKKSMLDLLEKASADPDLLKRVRVVLTETGVRNPEAWVAYHGSNGPYFYSTVDTLTPNEERLFKKSTCCSANFSREYIRVLDKSKRKKVVAVHTAHCPQIKEAYWQGPPPSLPSSRPRPIRINRRGL